MSIKNRVVKVVRISALITTAFIISIPAHATINCAGYLPNSYFERIENREPFAGKLVNKDGNTQQLQNLDSKVLLDNLTDAYILMDTYLLAKQHDKYGVANAAGEIIIPFEYDDIHTEPDIATSFIVSINGGTDANINVTDATQDISQQGIINRYGDWIYPLSDARVEHAHYDSDYDQDFFIIAKNSGLTGLLDDRGYWAIMPKYDSIYPLNACTGKPLYLQVSSQAKTALIDQNNGIIIPLAANQHIELFNDYDGVPLFLRSILVAGSSAEGMSQDIEDDIISAQIIDANGKLLLSSDAPISKLLYHQLYAYKKAGKYGFIDDRVKVVVEPQFDSYRDDADKVWVEKQGELVRLESLINLD